MQSVGVGLGCALWMVVTLAVSSSDQSGAPQWHRQKPRIWLTRHQDRHRARTRRALASLRPAQGPRLVAAQ